MVKIALNFLLGIPNDQIKHGSEESETSNGKNSSDNSKDEAMKNYKEHKVDKPVFMCHLEYILAPEEQPKSIDIIHWGKVAKIYVEEDSSAIMPLTLDKICWIYFRVKHVITINNDRVNDFLNHSVVVKASVGNKNLGQAAKTEKAQVFYGPEDGKDKLFPTMSQNLMENTAKREIFGTKSGVLDVNFESCTLSNRLQKLLLNLSREYNDVNIEKKPTILQGEQPQWRNIKDVKHELTNDPKGNTDKKEKDSISKYKGDQHSDISLIITGESILSGLKILKNYVKYNSQELPFFCCIAKVTDVLTPEQAKYYNPFSFTLKRLHFMPVSVLQRENIEKIRMRFVISDLYEVESTDMKIDANMILNYTRTILTDRISTPELMELIQTKGLRVQMIGIRSDVGNAQVTPSLYKDQRINSKSGLPGKGLKNSSFNKTNTTILGNAIVDISSILLEPHCISAYYNFTCGKSCYPTAAEYSTTVNPTEVNFGLKCENECHILNSSQIVLTLTVRLCFPLIRKCDVVKASVPIRNCLFILLHDIKTALRILKIIQLGNDCLSPTDYSKTSTSIERPLSVYHSGGTNPDNTDLSTHSLTGFVIDCVDTILIYVEGPSLGILREIWSVSSSIIPSNGRILYDSSLILNNVTHKELLRFGGFYVIILQETPTALLSNQNAHKEGNIPKPAYKALMQINELSQCPSITTAIQKDLFPDYQSLLSLDLEFGVPLKSSLKPYRTAENKHFKSTQ